MRRSRGAWLSLRGRLLVRDVALSSSSTAISRAPIAWDVLYFARGAPAPNVPAAPRRACAYTLRSRDPRPACLERRFVKPYGTVPYGSGYRTSTGSRRALARITI